MFWQMMQMMCWTIKFLQEETYDSQPSQAMDLFL
jgi:hypothetical protein